MQLHTDGVDLQRVISRKPEIPPGFLVLQDLPEVVSNVEAHEKIELMAHDFFKKQPVIGMFPPHAHHHEMLG